jgi:hypothetical protein
MATFLVVYDPSKAKEPATTDALHRWRGTRILRGAWVIEFDATADLARRTLVAVGGPKISCAIVEIKPNGDHAEVGVDPAGQDALQSVGGLAGQDVLQRVGVRSARG